MFDVPEAKRYRKLGDGKIQCLSCAWKCVISEGSRGVCGTKVNVGGKLLDLVYGRVSSAAIDPIEKKPLYHFYPATPTLSVATIGCNFKCPWCQNWFIAHVDVDKYFKRLPYVPPEAVVETARELESPIISFTYNEPTIWFDYAMDVAKEAKKLGFKIVFVTNGFFCDEFLDEAAKYIDAANVDIKAFKKETYTKLVKGRLEPVLQAVEELKKKGVHIETTLLLIPTVNDDMEEVKALAKWQHDVLGPDTPLHISRFHPDYMFMDVPPTPLSTMEKAYKVAKEVGLRYVYLGNVPGHESENTYCPSCGKLVIGRFGFEVVEWNIEDGRCKFCGEKIAVVGDLWRGPKRYFYDAMDVLIMKASQHRG